MDCSDCNNACVTFCARGSGWDSQLCYAYALRGTDGVSVTPVENFSCLLFAWVTKTLCMANSVDCQAIQSNKAEVS